MNQYPSENNYGIVYYYSGIISLGSLVFGFFIGVFNAIQTYEVYYNDLQDDQSQKSVFIGLCNSLLAIGAVIGCLMISILTKARLSYKGMSNLMDVIGIIACAIMMVDLTKQYLYIGRLLCGVFTGIQSSIVIIYIKEIAPSEVVGKAGTFNQLFVTIGLAISFSLSFIIPQQYSFDAIQKTDNKESNEELYQFLQDNKLKMQLIQLIPISVMLLRMVLISKIKLNPPYYNIKEYETYFTKIYHTENEMQIKIKEIKEVFQQRNLNGGVSSYSIGNERRVSNLTFWKRFVVGFILSMSVQLTGINVIIFYSNDIFEKMGSGESAKMYTLLLGILQIVFTLFSTKYIEQYGRKFMMLLGELFIIAGLVLISISSNYNIGLLSLFAIFLHLLGFSISFGPVVWIYIVEILEESYVAIMSLNSWAFTIAISFGVPFLISYSGLFATFLLFSCVNVFIIAFLSFYVVETKGKTFYQIQNEYNQINNTDLSNVPHVELQ